MKTSKKEDPLPLLYVPEHQHLREHRSANNYSIEGVSQVPRFTTRSTQGRTVETRLMWQCRTMGDRRKRSTCVRMCLSRSTTRHFDSTFRMPTFSILHKWPQAATGTANTRFPNSRLQWKWQLKTQKGCGFLCIDRGLSHVRIHRSRAVQAATGLSRSNATGPPLLRRALSLAKAIRSKAKSLSAPRTTTAPRRP